LLDASNSTASDLVGDPEIRSTLDECFHVADSPMSAAECFLAIWEQEGWTPPVAECLTIGDVLLAFALMPECFTPPTIDGYPAV